MTQVEFLSTLGCHLCEVAESLIRRHLPHNVQLMLIDICEHDAYMARFAAAIPVLLNPASDRYLAWPFDGDQLDEFFSSL